MEEVAFHPEVEEASEVVEEVVEVGAEEEDLVVEEEDVVAAEVALVEVDVVAEEVRFSTHMLFFICFAFVLFCFVIISQSIHVLLAVGLNPKPFYFTPTLLLTLILLRGWWGRCKKKLSPEGGRKRGWRKKHAQCPHRGLGLNCVLGKGPQLQARGLFRQASPSMPIDRVGQLRNTMCCVLWR